MDQLFCTQIVHMAMLKGNTSLIHSFPHFPLFLLLWIYIHPSIFFPMLMLPHQKGNSIFSFLIVLVIVLVFVHFSSCTFYV